MAESALSTRSEVAPPSLEKFFAPSSIAMVGATDDLSKYGGACLYWMRRFGYSGKLYPVNPRRREVQGLPCYPSLLEIPGPIDHVGVVVPAERVFGVLEQCEVLRVPFVTIYTSGFTESGTREGREMQDRIGDFARRTGIRIMGPNCNGFVNYVDGVAMTYTNALGGPQRPAGRVGIVSQSGALGQVSVMWQAQQLGIGISYEISCGNGADLDALDFVRFMVEDPSTDVILLAVEHLAGGARLARVARLAREREKPIVVLKIGRTEAGRRAAASHTGSVTGSDAAFDAAFRQFGLMRVEDFNELYEVAMMLQTGRRPNGTGIASMSSSGGNLALLSDMGASMGLTHAKLSAATRASLSELLPGYGSVRNPVDLTTVGLSDNALYRSVLDAVLADEGVDAMVPLLTFVPRMYLEEIAEASRGTSKPVAVLWVGGCSDDPTVGPAALVEAGVPVYRSTASCLKALRAAVAYGNMVRSPLPPADPALSRPEGPPPNLEGIRETLRQASGAMAERRSKQLLAAYGFPMVQEEVASSPQEAVQLARQIGYPVALKINSPDILHKTEAGALRLGLSTEEAVRHGFDEVYEAARRYNPAARLEGMLVQEMVKGGMEVMLGLVADPSFGSVLVAGLGGIHVEVLRDLAYRIPPVNIDEARAMLRELRAYRLLEGVRGAAPRDLDALVSAIVRLSWLAVDLGPEIAELDINPLMVLEQGSGVRVVDALLVPAKAGPSPIDDETSKM